MLRRITRQATEVARILEISIRLTAAITDPALIGKIIDLNWFDDFIADVAIEIGRLRNIVQILTTALRAFHSAGSPTR
jgi:hypothetical protein